MLPVRDAALRGPEENCVGEVQPHRSNVIIIIIIMITIIKIIQNLIIHDKIIL
jgi:hypothetical protein